VNGTLYFSANDGTNGLELWKVNNTTGLPELVADINPGALNSSPSQITQFNGKIYFNAVKADSGSEIWAIDFVEFEFLENTTLIPNNTGVVNFGLTPIGSPVTKTFTIKNTGPVNLSLGGLTLPPGFTVVTPPATSVAPGATTTLVIRFNQATVGNFSGNLTLITNDSEQLTYTFKLEAATESLQQISILDGATILRNGVGRINFDTTSVGTTLTRTFTIKNNGGFPLNIGAITLPAGYTVITPPASLLLKGESTTITIILNASVKGTFNGDLTIASNDNTNNPFIIKLSGKVKPARRR
jgi:ELWxxDGT repeat protein